MDGLSFKYGGVFEYPVINRSESFTLNSRFRFTMSLQADISDEAKYKTASVSNEAGEYFKDNMHRFMNDAMSDLWNGPMPLKELIDLPHTLPGALANVLSPQLELFGLRLGSFSIAAVAFNEEDRQTLNEREDKELLARGVGKSVKPDFIDICYKPGNDPGPGIFFPAGSPIRPFQKDMNAPWSCSACGAVNNTGRFCPNCGTPRPNA